MVVTRFAPSPTGELHLGHAYAALYAQHLAKEESGKCLLRFEDIDHTRVREEYYQQIEDDLTWLGIEWETPVLKQRDRLPAYEDALRTLQQLEVVYPCFCTRKEIEAELAAINNAPHGSEGPLYPGTCRNLSPTERAERIASGESHCWRLDADAAIAKTGPLLFEDKIWGQVGVDTSLLGDVVLARKDIATSYHLAVIVDDAFQDITDVTRGEDLLPSTHIHRILQELLGLPEPIYHHHRLILDENGQRLAKRDQSKTLRLLRENGKNASEIRDFLLDPR